MNTATLTEPQTILERWETICADPNLGRLPYRMELRGNQIIMSPPPGIRHGNYQGKVLIALERHGPHGHQYGEIAVVVETGVIGPDAVWNAAPLNPAHSAATPAPDICIEIESPSNTPEEFARKRLLYFSAGAKEFWTVDKEGKLAFYVRLTDTPSLPYACAHVARSELIPEFPVKLV